MIWEKKLSIVIANINNLCYNKAARTVKMVMLQQLYYRVQYCKSTDFNIT